MFSHGIDAHTHTCPDCGGKWACRGTDDTCHGDDSDGRCGPCAERAFDELKRRSHDS